MKIDPLVLLAIAGMSLATYAARAGGYALFRALRSPGWLRDALGYVPGALFVGYVVPALAAGGPGEWAGAAATLSVMIGTRNLLLAILVGTATAWGTTALR